VTNPCTFPGCQAQIESAHVACLTHWKLVPKEVRNQVQFRRIVCRDKPAARAYLREWFISQIRKVLPPVELPPPRVPEPRSEPSRRFQPRIAQLIELVDSLLAEYEVNA
jgi:hypothetical protein